MVSSYGPRARAPSIRQRRRRASTRASQKFTGRRLTRVRRVDVRGYEDDEGAVYIYAGPDDAAPVVVRPPDSPVALQEFGYAVAYASGRFVVGARELGADKVGAAFLYSL